MYFYTKVTCPTDCPSLSLGPLIYSSSQLQGTHLFPRNPPAASFFFLASARSLWYVSQHSGMTPYRLTSGERRALSVLPTSPLRTASLMAKIPTATMAEENCYRNSLASNYIRTCVHLPMSTGKLFPPHADLPNTTWRTSPSRPPSRAINQRYVHLCASWVSLLDCQIPPCISSNHNTADSSWVSYTP